MLHGLKKYFVTFLILACCCIPLTSAKTIRLDETNLNGEHFKYVYQWYDPDVKPKAIVIAVHGLTMHGSVFDGLANHLVGEGMLVLAPDLPGYGRCRQSEISYSQATNQITEIIKMAKQSYKNLPIFCIGESLGANLIVYATDDKSASVDGLILVSPALKPRLHIRPWTVKDDVNMLIGLIDANATFDLSPYIKAYVSEDPNIAKAALNDPLVRTQLSCQDVWHTYETMQPIYKEARLVQSSTATLIMQGSKDRVLNSKAIIKLVSNLNTSDLTVKWFKGRGHLIVEMPDPKIDVLQTIDQWLQLHINESLLQAQSVQPNELQVHARLSNVDGTSFNLPATIK